VPEEAMIGTRHDPRTSVTECFTGISKSVAATYPAQFDVLLEPWRITGKNCRGGVEVKEWRSA
jgi:hypothetical protein